MASRYWVGTTTSWNTSSNWSATSGGAGGAGVPTSSDDVIFDGNGTNNCTCDVAISCLSIDVQSGYTGTLDYADSSYSHAIAGDCTYAGSGIIDCGNSTITIAGNFDNTSQSTFTDASSSHVFTGSSKTLNISSAYFHNIRFSGNTTITGAFLYCDGAFVIDTGVTLTLSNDSYFGLYPRNGATYTNDGTILIPSSKTSAQINFRSVTASGGIGTITDNSTSGSLFSFLSSNSVGTSVFNIQVKFNTLTTDTYTATGNQTFNDTITFLINAGDTLNIANNTNNPSFTIQGDVILTNSGTFNWVKGTGIITFSGTNNQSIDFNGELIEDIEIDKTSGTVTLTGDVDPDTVTISDGTLDIDGNNITTTGAFTQALGTTCQDTTGGGLITVGGNFAINGTAGNPCVWNGPDLDITGTATASQTTVTNSNATAGTNVIATNCTDNGGNTGWNFGTPSQYRRAQLITSDNLNMGVLLQI